MAVRQRGETFQADVTWGGQRVRQGGFETRAKAEQWEATTLDRMKRGVVSDVRQAARLGDVSTLRELLDRTYNQFWRGSKAEATTLANAERVVELLGPDTHPNAIGEGDVDFLVGKLRDKGLSGGTINRYLATLSKMMKYGKQRGWVDRMPHAQRQRESEHRVRWLTEAEEQDALKWAAWFGWHELRDLVTVLVDSGLRISEALRLTFKDTVDGWLRVWTSKNGRPRSVPQTDRVRAVIERRRQEAGDRETVFTIDRHQADKMWSAVREKMGLEKDEQFVIHALRHTTASRLVQAGVDLPSVQQVMGHTTIQTTMRYAHLAPKNLVNAMSALQGGAPLSAARPALRLVGQVDEAPIPKAKQA